MVSGSTITDILVNLFKEENPQIALMGATVIGRDLGPRVSSSLTSGLTADCTELEIGEYDDKKSGKHYDGLLYQIRPAFGGNIVATIVNPEHRPQMATVRSGVMQKIKPSDVTVNMYDAGVTFHYGGFIAEVEYLYKHYSHNAFHDVHAFDGFACYDIPVRTRLIKKVSPLVRYDFMSDHSDGSRYNATDDDLGELIINDYKRHRVTGGVTLSLSKPFISDVRINYEKYFYREGGIAKPSEKDKIVVEFMTRF